MNHKTYIMQFSPTFFKYLLISRPIASKADSITDPSSLRGMEKNVCVSRWWLWLRFKPNFGPKNQKIVYYLNEHTQKNDCGFDPKRFDFCLCVTKRDGDGTFSQFAFVDVSMNTFIKTSRSRSCKRTDIRDGTSAWNEVEY